MCTCQSTATALASGESSVVSFLRSPSTSESGSVHSQQGHHRILHRTGSKHKCSIITAILCQRVQQVQSVTDMRDVPFSPGRRRPPGSRKLSPLCSSSTCGKRWSATSSTASTLRLAPCFGYLCHRAGMLISLQRNLCSLVTLEGVPHRITSYHITAFRLFGKGDFALLLDALDASLYRCVFGRVRRLLPKIVILHWEKRDCRLTPHCHFQW